MTMLAVADKTALAAYSSKDPFQIDDDNVEGN